MVKTKKARLRKEFRYGVNRKKKAKHLQNRMIPPLDPINNMRQTWKIKKNAKQNFQGHGVVYNLNKLVHLDQNEPVQASSMKIEPQSLYEYVSKLTQNIEEGVKDKPKFRLSPKLVELLSYYLDKYGEDYKAMTRDIRNYNQDTWRQIWRKMEKFKNSSDQYAQYLKNRNLI